MASSDQLNQADVERLIADPSPVTRAETAGKVAAAFERGELSGGQRQLGEQIFRLMVRDAAVSVRAALSKHLQRSPDLPRDIALALARDVEDVAIPMLESSDVLTDEDLLQLVAGSGDSQQAAVARRATVSEPVAAALVETGSAEVIATLLQNRGAQVTEPILLRSVERHGRAEAVQAALIHRDRLPVTVAERLVALVSDRLRDYLLVKHQLPEAAVTDLVLKSRERATMALLPPGAPEPDLERLVDQMRINGRLTPSVIMRALCVGDLAFFEASLASLARVPLVNGRALIHDRGARGLKAIYDRAGLPADRYRAFRIAFDVTRELDYDGGEHDRERYVRRLIERILTQYEDLGSEDLDWLIGKLEEFSV